MGTKPTLYFSYDSFPSRKVLMYLYEKGVNFDSYVIDVDEGENFCSWYLRINPRGEVPSLVLDNTYILGSEEILEYVEDRGLGSKSILLSEIDNENCKLSCLLESLSALPIEALTFGTVYFPPHRTNDIPPFDALTHTKKMIKYAQNTPKILREASDSNRGTPSEAIFLAMSMECSARMSKYSIEDEYMEVLRRFQSIIDDIEDQLLYNCISISTKVQMLDEEDKHLLRYINGKSFSVIDCVLSVVLLQLEELGYSDLMLSERPSLTYWWRNAKERKSFIKSTAKPTLNFELLKRRMYRHRFTITAALGLTAVFVFSYLYTKRTYFQPRVTNCIVHNK